MSAETGNGLLDAFEGGSALGLLVPAGTHEHRVDDVGAAGRARQPTPLFQRLQQQGVVPADEDGLQTAREHLVQSHSVRPHIRLDREFPVRKTLRSVPASFKS